MAERVLSELSIKYSRFLWSTPGNLSKRASIRQLHSKLSDNDPYIKVSNEVKEALLYRQPVVALETTIYTHGTLIKCTGEAYKLISCTGFPYPDNTALASRLESIVRTNGGIPATIGVLNGVARVGFSADELIELTASAGRPETRKVSRRDLPYILGLVFLTIPVLF